ncbi:MAG: glucosylceramidase, partial [Spirochaetes bacterium]
MSLKLVIENAWCPLHQYLAITALDKNLIWRKISTIMNIQVFETAQDNKNGLKPSFLQITDNTGDVKSSIVHVVSSKIYQSIIGFGGAFTDSASNIYAQLDKPRKKKVIEAYFDKEKGNAYTLGRLAIHSCDFSSGNYCYVDKNDTDLASFSVGHDEKEIFPFILDAQRTAGGLKYIASPWSPPAWMKTNNNMCSGGSLKKEYYALWAEYFIKYIEAYRKKGISVWGVTVQNEAGAAQTWESCVYTAEDERDFVKKYLGPTLDKAGLGDINIIVHDHNRDNVLNRCRIIYDDPEAAKYIWGAGVHWYEGDNFQNLNALNELYPEKSLLFTEGCQENGTHHNSWALGERYGKSIINDMNNWIRGWIDWNLLLDISGGP